MFTIFGEEIGTLLLRGTHNSVTECVQIEILRGKRMAVRHVVLANSHLQILKLGLRTKNNSYPFVWERKIDLKGSTPVSAKN